MVKCQVSKVDDDFCSKMCTHFNEHEENTMCTNGVCPITFKHLNCPNDPHLELTEEERREQVTNAILKIAENVEEAFKRDFPCTRCIHLHFCEEGTNQNCLGFEEKGKGQKVFCEEE